MAPYLDPAPFWETTCESDAPRVLLVLGRDRQARAIAETIRVRLVLRGMIVELADASSGAAPPPSDYDLVIVGATMGWMQDRESMKYIADHRDELRQTPAGLFVVARAHASAELAGLLFEIGWHPLRVASFPRIGRIEYWRDPHRHDSADRRVANAFAAELATLVASSRAAAAAVPAVLAPARSPAQPLREGPDLDLPVPLHWPLG